MSNKKQTAVDWLFKKMITEKHTISEWNDIANQAKEMDKQNIEDAYVDGLNAHRTNFWNNSQDYKETYEQENMSDVSVGSLLKELKIKLHTSGSYDIPFHKRSIMDSGKICDHDDGYLCECRTSWILEFFKSNCR